MGNRYRFLVSLIQLELVKYTEIDPNRSDDSYLWNAYMFRHKGVC